MPFKSEHQYEPISSPGAEDAGERYDSWQNVTLKRTLRRTMVISTILTICCVCLAVTNFISYTTLKTAQAGVVNTSPYTGLDQTPIDRVNGYWMPQYRSDNMSEADEVWEGIKVGAGMVAVERQWAASHGLPPSIDYPPDSSKAAYFIAAYHSLHCLPYLRRIVKRFIADDLVDDRERDHAFHCINVLREELMCTASDALLSITPGVGADAPAAGHDQNRKCTNWGPMRDWALENTACWTPPDEQMRKHVPAFGHECYDTDGIILPN